MHLLVPTEVNELPQVRVYDYEVQRAQMDGMIVPHHDLASQMIETMYKRVASEPKSILLISPDHNLDGNRKITLSRRPWANTYDQVWIDQNLCERLLSLDFVHEDHYEIEIEHGLNIHMAYISKYFQAKVTPVMISKETSIEELNDFIQLIPDDIFVIASVDFSHYKSRQEAYLNDEFSLELLRANRKNDLFIMSDAYFDSPHCIYVMMTLYKDWTLYEHKNSSDYISNDYHTTSYMNIGFKQ